MRYLLDTNVVSDLVRNPQGKVARHVRTVGEKHVCTSIIVAAELRYGADKKLLRTRLEQAGTPIGANDLLIAAQALALGYVMVTDNEREFSRVAGLRLQNWLRSTTSCD